MTQITGKIYQMTNGKTGAALENRFPRTVMEAVLGLNTYLQQQFSALADIYMPIEGISEALTDQEFVFRKSPNTIKAKSLTLDRIKGRTLSWNQLVQNGNFENTSNWSRSSQDITFSVSNNVATVEAQSSGDRFLQQNVAMIVGHKYKIGVEIKANVAGRTCVIFFYGEPGTNRSLYSCINADTWERKDHIVTCASSTYNAVRLHNGYSGDVHNYRNMTIVDLTLLYGTEIDGLTDEQILAKYEADFGTGYHEYNAGTLISNDASALETVGFNKWDGVLESGYYDTNNGQPVTSSSWKRSKNPIMAFPNTDYYVKSNNSGFAYLLYYDAGMNYLGSSASDGSVQRNTVHQTPANCFYIHFYANASWNASDFCINLSDASKNGTYEPYRKSTLHLGLNNIRVKSHNIWDEEWENGYYAAEDGRKIYNDSYMMCKNLIPVLPSTQYYINVPGGDIRQRFYRKDKSYIGYDAQRLNSGIIETPQDCYYIAFFVYSRTTYNNDICINVSSSFNGQYEPHGILTINGVKSAGSVYDEIVGNKLIKRVGEVDMGTLNWLSGADKNEMYTTSFTDKKIASSGDKSIICSKFEVRGSDSWSSIKANNCIYNSYTNNKELYIGTEDRDAGAFKIAMSGVMLNYVLATPVEYELAEPLVPTVKAGTTEARISPNADGLSAPFRADITYSASENNDAATSQYAATAGRLLNAQTIWGQTFDGSSPVSGALTGVTTIDASGAITAGSFVKSGGTASQFLKANGSVDNTAYYHSGNSNLNTVDWAVRNLTLAGTITGATSIDSLLYFDTTNGRVGIGTSSPAHKLDVSGTFRATGNSLIGGNLTVGTSSARKIFSIFGDSNLAGKVYVGKDEPSAPCFVLDADSQEGLKIRPDNAATTHYMHITTGGILTVTDGIVCNAYITAGAAAASSDARLKDNVSAISTDKALSILSSLRGAEWDWNEKSGLYGQHGSGLVAQEVQKVMPWAVLEFNDKLSLNYNSLWGIVIPVIQSLKKRIEELESRLA